jgi:hypothetical protein
MLPHLRSLAAINCVRSLLGLGLALLFLYHSDGTRFSTDRFKSLMPGDLQAFFSIGVTVLVLSILRGWQGVYTLIRLRRHGRRGIEQEASALFQLSHRLGFALAVYDVANVASFPVSTACGLYGLWVYRHRDISQFYSVSPPTIHDPTLKVAQ